jgi:hypothetical protein
MHVAETVRHRSALRAPACESSGGSDGEASASQAEASRRPDGGKELGCCLCMEHTPNWATASPFEAREGGGGERGGASRRSCCVACHERRVYAAIIGTGVCAGLICMCARVGSSVVLGSAGFRV